MVVFFINLSPYRPRIPYVVDFKKWGIKAITDDLLKKQHIKIHRLKKIYFEEKEKTEEYRK